MSLRRTSLFALLLAGQATTGGCPYAGPIALPAQQPPLDALVLRLAGMSAVTGLEQAMADSVRALLPGAALDRLGSVVLTVGSGEPRRAVVCALDEVGYVVGGVTPEGYLTLRRVGNPPGPLFDQALEGQRVTVFGQRGAVSGVVGVRSTHLTRGRPPVSEQPFSLDQAFVDVGASSAEEVAALGVRLLSPLTRAKLPHRYGPDRVAAPFAAARAGCAALVDAARAARAARAALRTPLARAAARERGTGGGGGGTTVFALAVQGGYGASGLRFLAAAAGPFDRTLLLEPLAAAPRDLGEGAARADTTAGPERLAALGLTTRLRLPAAYLLTPAETVSLRDVAALRDSIVAFARSAR